jgi:hypothetical protein
MPPLDFEKLKSGAASKKQTDPRKIFTTLRRDTAKFKRPLDEQSDVLDAWYARRAQRDITLKMNTGAGKTVVGLLILQSCLNEGVGPAAYVAPDVYLVNQVLAEARSLGIATTQAPDDPAFMSGEAILVINIWKLVNGRSVFGVGREGIKIKIGSLVVDDAHACLAIAAEQFRLTLGATHPAFEPLLNLFREDLRNQSLSGLLDVEADDPRALMAVPFWTWQSHIKDVLKILHPHRKDDTLKWPWPLLEDVLPLCQCVFGGGSLEIAPRFLPIDNIPAFAAAKRRIYMTATLADDGILVSHFQADPAQIAEPIRPKGGGDIGDRMILAPQEINPLILTDDVKALAAKLSTVMNVCVIVPSNHRAGYWADVAVQTLTADNMQAGTAKLRAGHVGLSVFVGKYDGVDLPGEACRLLIIDGLPEVNGLIDRVEQSILDGTRRQLVRQIQRIEQGMGRGVRSSEDYCVVLLLGSRLIQRLHNPEARGLFSVATRAQLDLGREVTSQIKGKSIAEIEGVMNLCFTRNDEWVDASKNVIVNAEGDEGSHVDQAMIDLRAAFDEARSSRFDLAEASAQRAVTATSEPRAKAYVRQQLAEYVQHTNPVMAQEIQLAAVQQNRALVRPIAGITYRKLTVPNSSQAAAAVEFMKRFLEQNDLIMWVAALVESLAWGEENTDRFEAAMFDLGGFLGFGSQRPEKEVGKGPDNLWATGSLKYFVIECKSGATGAKAINKHDCNQLNGSMTWFGQQYDKSCSATPVMVHPQIVPEHAATLLPETRIITVSDLKELTNVLKSYSIAVGKGGYGDAKVVTAQLQHFGLTHDNIIARYTTKARKS